MTSLNSKNRPSRKEYFLSFISCKGLLGDRTEESASVGVRVHDRVQCLFTYYIPCRQIYRWVLVIHNFPSNYAFNKSLSLM